MSHPSSPSLPFAVTCADALASPLTAPPEKRLSGSGEQTLWNAYSDPSGQFHVGHWEGTVGALAVTYTEHELCVLLTGRVRLTAADDGGSVTFAAGEAFVIPAGFRGVWETLEPCRKLYAIFDPITPPA